MIALERAPAPTRRHRLRPPPIVMTALALGALMSLVACNPAAGGQTLNTQPPIVRQLPSISETDQHSRGTIVSSSALTDISSTLADAASWSSRIVYRSISGLTGKSVEVSGTFFVPRGPVPVEGWNVISFAHDTTGITPDCGPSGRPDLFGYDLGVAGFLKQGFAVAMTDYQGLDADAPHPYLEPRSAGFNVIDAVRALEEAVPQVSNRFVAVGISQGGQAVWAANELNNFYGAGLDYLGSVALTPAANLSDEANRAYARSLTPDQIGFWPMLMTGLQNQGVDIPNSVVVNSKYAADLPVLTGCDANARGLAMAKLTASDVGPSTQAEMVSIQDALRRNALPQYPLSAPMLVEDGSDDKMVPTQWTADAVRRSCDMGSPQLKYVTLAGKGHYDIVIDQDAVDWINARFADKPAPTTCETNS